MQRSNFRRTHPQSGTLSSPSPTSIHQWRSLREPAHLRIQAFSYGPSPERPSAADRNDGIDRSRTTNPDAPAAKTSRR